MGGVGKGPGIGWLRDGKCVAANFSIFERFKIKQGRQNDECLSMYIINTIPHGKCFVRYLRTPCFCNRNLTRSLRLLVRQNFPLSILYIRWAQRHTDIAVREGRGYSTNFYTAEAHPLTFYIPFFTISYTFY